MTVRSGRLTRTQALIMEAILAYEATHDDGPHLEEIAHAIGTKTASNICRQVKQLARMGLVANNPRIPRSLRSINPRALTVLLPKHLDDLVRDRAKRGGVPPQAVIIEFVQRQGAAA